MTLGRRIAEARKARGWSQSRLGQEVGKSQSAIAAYELDLRTPSRRDVHRIAEKLQVSAAQLEGVSYRDADDNVKAVPMLSWVSAGALNDVGSLEAVDAEEWITVGGLPPGEYFATEVRGDSMDRLSPENSIILVNIADRRLISGKAYVFAVRGETTYKIYQREPVVRLEPFSTSPANKTIFPTDKDWAVIGRVVRSYIDLS